MNHPRPPGLHLGPPPRGPRQSGLQMPQGVVAQGGTSLQPLSAMPQGVQQSGLANPASQFLPQPQPTPVPVAQPRRSAGVQVSDSRSRMQFSGLIGQLMADAETVPMGNALRKIVPGNPVVILTFTGSGKQVQWSKLAARDLEIDIPKLRAELDGQLPPAEPDVVTDERQAVNLLSAALGRAPITRPQAAPTPPVARPLPAAPPVPEGASDVILDEARTAHAATEHASASVTRTSGGTPPSSAGA